MSGVDLPEGATTAELLAAVRALAERVEQLEGELEAVRRRTSEPGVPDDVVLAISAAVAAFLGHRAKVKQVHYRTGQAWAQQGRVVVQGQHNVRSR
jgi:methylmalonyl-CoA carboxyltransferase 12S subunit